MNSRLAILGVACLGLAACGSSHSVTPRATATPTPTASVAPSSSPSGALTAGTLITVTGSEAMSVTGFAPYNGSVSDANAVCQASTTAQNDGFGIEAEVGPSSQGAGDFVTVQVASQSGGAGPVYTGSGTYAVNYAAVPVGTDPLMDGVTIDSSVGVAVVTMWQGTITVDSGAMAASFSGTYGLQLGAGGAYSTLGQISGSVTCPPGAPS